MAGRIHILFDKGIWSLPPDEWQRILKIGASGQQIAISDDYEILNRPRSGKPLININNWKAIDFTNELGKYHD